MNGRITVLRGVVTHNWWVFNDVDPDLDALFPTWAQAMAYADGLRRSKRLPRDVALVERIIRDVASGERTIREAARILDVAPEQITQAVDVWQQRELVHADPDAYVDCDERGYASDQIDRLLERVDMEWGRVFEWILDERSRGAA